jgi:hypothetical protein
LPGVASALTFQLSGIKESAGVPNRHWLQSLTMVAELPPVSSLCRFMQSTAMLLVQVLELLLRVLLLTSLKQLSEHATKLNLQLTAERSSRMCLFPASPIPDHP